MWGPVGRTATRVATVILQLPFCATCQRCGRLAPCSVDATTVPRVSLQTWFHWFPRLRWAETKDVEQQVDIWYCRSSRTNTSWTDSGDWRKVSLQLLLSDFHVKERGDVRKRQVCFCNVETRETNIRRGKLKASCRIIFKTLYSR